MDYACNYNIYSIGVVLLLIYFYFVKHAYVCEIIYNILSLRFVVSLTLLLANFTPNFTLFCVDCDFICELGIFALCFKFFGFWFFV